MLVRSCCSSCELAAQKHTTELALLHITFGCSGNLDPPTTKAQRESHPVALRIEAALPHCLPSECTVTCNQARPICCSIRHWHPSHSRPWKHCCAKQNSCYSKQYNCAGPELPENAMCQHLRLASLRSGLGCDYRSELAAGCRDHLIGSRP